jgi:hypothetical protein
MLLSTCLPPATHYPQALAVETTPAEPPAVRPSGATSVANPKMWVMDSCRQAGSRCLRVFVKYPIHTGTCAPACPACAPGAGRPAQGERAVRWLLVDHSRLVWVVRFRSAAALRFSDTRVINVRKAWLTAFELGKYSQTSGSRITVFSRNCSARDVILSRCAFCSGEESRPAGAEMLRRQSMP